MFIPPFSEKLLLKRKKIKRDLLASRNDWLEKRIAILGGSTTHDIRDVLELFLLNQGIKPAFYESEYNQYWQDVMFDNADLEEFKPDIIFIHTSNRNISKFPAMNESKKSVDELLKSQYQHQRL